MKTWKKVVLAASLALGLISVGVVLGRAPLLLETSAETSPQPATPDAAKDNRARATRASFTQPGLAKARGRSSMADGSLADIAEEARASVVSIASKHEPKPSSGASPVLPFPFPGLGGLPIPLPNQQTPNRPRQGLGSGVVVSSDGIILTNNHVIEDASEITVIDVNDHRYAAKVVGADPPSDLAVLKLEGENISLPALSFGDSDAVRPGDVVLAIGNPFGVGQTVTMGIISAKGRSAMGIVDYEDFIQTDAAINPGNSGGALISMDGRLIGINTAILSRTGGNNGIGFAVPAKMAQPIMQSLLDHGKVERGFLGVTIQDVDEDLAEAMGLKSRQGVLVTDVAVEGPAADGGIQRGDLLLKLDGNAVTNVTQLRNGIAAIAPGTKVDIELERKGDTEHVTVKLGELPSHKAGSASAPTTGPSFGIRLAPLNDEMRQQLGVEPGVSGAVVAGVTPDSPASHAGLRPGDIVLEVNGKQVRSPSEVASALSDKTKEAVLLLRRESRQLYVALKPPR